MTINLWLINLILILFWFASCVIVSSAVANQAATFARTDTKLNIPFVTISPQDSVKKLDQLKPGYKRTVNWNKYRSKVSVQAQNRCYTT